MKNLDFEAIFERYHQPLYRFCLSILASPEDAREALQNTMVKALRALPVEEREIQVKPWLYRVARNEAIDMLRQRRDRVELEVELVGSGEDLAAEAETRERLRTLLTDLRRLPERQRAALVMRELGGLGFTEIGEALDTSGASARQTVYEARLGLQRLQEGREMSCGTVHWELSGEDRRALRRRDIQAHLRECAECRAFRDAIAARRQDLGALAPLPAAASTGLLRAVLAGKAGSGAAAAGGAVGKVAATSTLVKSVATVAVVAVVAVPAADRAGLVHTGIFDPGPGPGNARVSRLSDPEGGAPSSADTSSSDGARQPAAVAAKQLAKSGGLSTANTVDERTTERKTSPQPQNGGPPDESTPSQSEGESARNTSRLPVASSHGQETAATHGGGRPADASHGQGNAHAPNEPAAHGPSHPSHPPHPAPAAEGKPDTPPPVQTPPVAPDKGGEPPLQPGNGNSGKPEEARQGG